MCIKTCRIKHGKHAPVVRRQIDFKTKNKLPLPIFWRCLDVAIHMHSYINLKQNIAVCQKACFIYLFLNALVFICCSYGRPELCYAFADYLQNCCA